MHACGHDVHSSSLLGVGKILQELRNDFEGTVKLIFQPGEERLPGGASLMIAEGVLENPAPQTIYGQHVFPELEAGQVGFRRGMYMASCDELHVTVHGKGGHGAMPHKNIDPVLIASHIVVALQQITSRNANPEIPTVLSFGRFIAEGATNIIPNTVALEGTFRTFNEEWRAEAHVKMKKMAETIAESMGGTCDFRIDKGYPFLVNDEQATSDAKSFAIEYLGEENVVDLPIRMTAEDFSYYSQVAPACFYRLGTADFSRGIDKPVHNAQFDIDERALETSIGLMSWIALRQLG
jgi:amidohydrolase